MSHSRMGHREEVDSRLLVVGSQIASLTPGLSFAHNLSCRCPNCQCKGIFDIYVSRPFQWHQDTPMRGVFPLAVELWTFGSPEDSKTQLFQVLSFTPTLGQSRGATKSKQYMMSITCFQLLFCFVCFSCSCLLLKLTMVKLLWLIEPWLSLWFTEVKSVNTLPCCKKILCCFMDMGIATFS
jgi:hypothetical protein